MLYKKTITLKEVVAKNVVILVQKSQQQFFYQYAVTGY